MKKKKSNFITICIFIVLLFLVFNGFNTTTNKSKIDKRTNFTIISSQENENLDSIITNYAKTKGYDVEIEYTGTLDIMSRINDGEKYDAVWLSNSMWGYMLNDVTLSNSKCTSITPVIFAIKKSKAQELGFIGKEIYTKDIVDAISAGKLKFSMSNPTVTNSGASAYLGMLSTLAGNPEVLTEEHLNNLKLQEQLKSLFSGLERSSGSEDFLEEMYMNGNYEAVVTYESSIINLNKKLISQGREPLYALYPVDGVSISDSTFAYIDSKDNNKKQIFNDIQTYILSNEGQKLLQEKGKRTWYGGATDNVDKTLFNPDWGIDTTKYITPIKYPSTAVIKHALNLYQTVLRKPIHVVFCLDYSGSMYVSGEDQLKEAMNYILTDKCASDYLQFDSEDKIDIVPFSTGVKDTWSTIDGTKTTDILKNIEATKTGGQTALYPAAIKALELLKDEDQNKFNTSVILMTDGIANQGTFYELKKVYNEINKQIPIFSIMFGEASEYQLKDIAILTNAKVFDGKKDLIKAFKEVRGYN